MDQQSANSELEDNFDSENKNYFIPGTGPGKGAKIGLPGDLPSSSIIEFRDQSIRRTEKKVENIETESPMAPGAIAKSNSSNPTSSSSNDTPKIGEQYRDAFQQNGGDSKVDHTQEFESQELKEMQYPRSILNYSKFINGILTFILVAEMIQYILPTEKVFLYFMNPTFIRVVMYTHMASLYINFVAFIYNFIFNVCANSGAVQRNKLRQYISIMIWCFAIFLVRILWEISIQDYRWLVNMNNHEFQK